MTDSPKPDLAEHEEEAVPLDEVLRQLLNAKPAVKPPESGSPDTPPSPPED